MSKKNKYKRKESNTKNNTSNNVDISAAAAVDEDALQSFLTGSKRATPKRIITDKQAMRGKVLRGFLRVVVVILTCIYSVFMNITAGIGMTIQMESELNKYGIPLLVATGVVILAAILALKKVNIPSVVLGVAGMIAVFVIVNEMCAVVDALALSDNEFQMLSDIYKSRHYPTGIAVLFQVLLCVAQYFSYDSTVKRAENKEKRRLERIEKEN